MAAQQVLVVSIDGVAPRFVTADTMPHLCGLAKQGAATFSAQTVFPSITLPAHASLLRGIDPSVHGIFDNRPLPLSDDWPSFLKTARSSGRRTAALLNWTQVNGLVEDDAVDVRYFLDGGYGSGDDALISTAATALLDDTVDVAFAYLVSPDLAGHDHGWGSLQYRDALAQSDTALGRLLDIWGERSVIVTTDHGGHGNDHQQSQPLDMETFVVVRATGIEPLSGLGSASILDIAPTVADLAGFAPADAWSGRSLIGTEFPIAEHLLAMVESMHAHSYGERVTMLEHSLQTAANAASAGASEQMIVAALLHDIGHLLGDAGAWGLPDHAGVGAQYLQQMAPRSVTEPIRLHVDAKRYLVATDTSYTGALSKASTESLVEQGGPFAAHEAAEFVATPWAADAIALRRFDDLGKASGADVASLASYRPLINRVLADSEVSARWLRDACTCPTCRDTATGQHLLDVADLVGWKDSGHREIVHGENRHQVSVDFRDSGDIPISHWTASHRSIVATKADASDMDAIVSELSRWGISLAGGLAPVSGSVLEFAGRLGYVRTTNYGDLFDVRASGDANNLAYTRLGLPLHTDNPYRDPVPSVQILHCLQPAVEGGSSLFCDGFSVAEQLREAEPDAFAVLTSTPLDFRFSDADVDLRARHPMIELALDGSVRAIHVNHRSMMTPAPGPQTEAFYDAYLAFAELLNSADNVVQLDLAAGDVVAFDNRRVLHSRTAFSTTTERHLQGCYVDIDAIHSRARKLAASR